jgi:hypothetical protein
VHFVHPRLAIRQSRRSDAECENLAVTAQRFEESSFKNHPSDDRVGDVRRRLGAIIGLGILGAVLGYAFLAESQTLDVRDLQLLRRQADRIRLTGPHRPPELVPPRAPGPGVIASAAR